MSEQERKSIEVRGFLHLKAVFIKKNWAIPLIIDLEEPLTGIELAAKLEIPTDEIEVIFVNGFVQSLNFLIQPGDRVAFVPPGCPGAHRMFLGFYRKNQDNKYNFTVKR